MKQIKITHPCGKVETIDGNFEEGVKIELVEKEKLWWFKLNSSGVHNDPRWYNEDPGYPFDKIEGAKTKEEAIKNYLWARMRDWLNDGYGKYWLECTLKELSKLNEKE